MGVIGGHWVVVGVQLQFVGSSFVVHLEFIRWSLEVIAKLFGVHLEFDGTMGVHWDYVRDNWRVLRNSWGSFGVCWELIFGLF